MKRAIRCATTLTLAAVVSFTTSACGQPEHPRTVSDICLADKRISADPAPVAGADDPGNKWDTEQTFGEIVEHNAVYDKLCPKPL